MSCLSQIFGDCLEFGSNRRVVGPSEGCIEAMVNVILDQRAFGLLNRLLHRMQFLRDIGAWLRVFDHLYDACQMPVGTFQPLDDCRMGCMRCMFCHIKQVIPLGG
jgi:hypothetical protein